MPKREAKKRLGTPVAKWLWGESDNFLSVNPFRGNTGNDDVDSLKARGRAAAAATDAARQERQASLGRDASHDDD